MSSFVEEENCFSFDRIAAPSGREVHDEGLVEHITQPQRRLRRHPHTEAGLGLGGIGLGRFRMILLGIE